MHEAAPTLPLEDVQDSSQSGDPTRLLAAHCQSYKGGDVRRSMIQLGITATLFVVLMSGMIASHIFGMWWMIALFALPASGLLVRLFIIQHDCGHGSFFPARAANEAVGRIISLLTVTPYDSWKRAHNIHHAASGNLDNRGEGSIDTLTVREYQALPQHKRIAYRLYRNPVVMLLLGTPLHVIVLQRIPFLTMAPFFESYHAVPPAQIWRSIVLLDVAMVAFYGTLAMVFGWQVLFTVCLPVLILTAWIGGWLFFVQHQFEETYWQRGETWKFRNAALAGSSYYVLPRIFQWFTGNIGLHHVHHLCSAIPNYRLQECLDQNHDLQQMNRMTFRDSLKCLGWSLWDEDRQRMVGFRHLGRPQTSY
ncbi:MAG: fatty acid desaturase [Micavibrio sp.]